MMNCLFILCIYHNYFNILIMSKIIIGREFPDELTAKVKNAEKSIKILIYDWRWYDGEVGERIQKFNNEIIRARQRGVDIQALVNSDYICNKLKDQDVNIKRINTKKTMHIKMLIVDNKYLFLGSHNLTKNAFELNHEISVLIEDIESIERCNNFFQNAWAL